MEATSWLDMRCGLRPSPEGEIALRRESCQYSGERPAVSILCDCALWALVDSYELKLREIQSRLLYG